jgi:F-type H+-transporting ATPase subunit b
MATHDAIIASFIFPNCLCLRAQTAHRKYLLQPGAQLQRHSYAMVILHQLGELFLEALPTVILLLLFVVFMRWAFFRPILQAMAERDALIEGARREAAAVEAEARQELDSYRDALRRARAQIYGEQEASRQAALASRAQLLKAMRGRALEDVAVAKKRIAAEVAAARAQIEIETPSLANNIARIILERPPSLTGGSPR